MLSVNHASPLDVEGVAQAMSSISPGRMLAVLCNPPLGEPERTTSWRNIKVLASVLGVESFSVVNLIPQPTRSTVDLADMAGKLDLFDVELRIAHAARAATVVVAGWGAGAPTGWPRSEWRNVVRAAATGLAAAGHQRVVHVSGTPRHPSRWRQHTSPVHDRYEGSSFEERLRTALNWSAVENLQHVPSRR